MWVTGGPLFFDTTSLPTMPYPRKVFGCLLHPQISYLDCDPTDHEFTHKLLHMHYSLIVFINTWSSQNNNSIKMLHLRICFDVS